MNLSLYLLVGLSTSSLIPEPEACLFVGARIFKEARMDCHEGACKVLSPDGTFQELPGNITMTCQDAVRRTSLIFDTLNNEPGRHKKQRREVEAVIEEFTSFISDKLNSKLKRLLWRAEDEPIKSADLAEANRMLLEMASDWFTWSSTLRPLLWESEAVSELLDLCQDFIRDRSTRGLREEDVYEQSSPVANFYFDIISLLDESRGPSKAVWVDYMISYLAKGGKPLYRDLYPLEVTFPPLAESPSLTSKFVLLVTEGLKALGEGRYQTRSVITPAMVFVGRIWSEDDGLEISGSAMQLLTDQVEKEVCPHLERIHRGYFGALNFPSNSKSLLRALTIMLRFVKLCRFAEPLKAMQVTQRIGELLDAPNGLIETSALNEAKNGKKTVFELDTGRKWPLTQWLNNPSVIESLRISIERFMHSTQIFDYIDGEVMLWSREELDDAFESSMRAFGRVLAVAHTLDLVSEEINIPDYMSNILARLQRGPTMVEIEDELNFYPETLLESLFEPLFYIQQGVVEVLGPAGLFLSAEAF